MYEWYEDEADDHEEEPCEYLLRSDRMPDYLLTRIYPDSSIGRDVLGYPDEEGNERESECEIHRVCAHPRSVVYSSPPECCEHRYEEEITYIVDEVMCKKVDVDAKCDDDGVYPLRVSSELKAKNSPYSCDIAPDCRIHESCKEWYTENP